MGRREYGERQKREQGSAAAGGKLREGARLRRSAGATAERRDGRTARRPTTATAERRRGGTAARRGIRVLDGQFGVRPRVGTRRHVATCTFRNADSAAVSVRTAIWPHDRTDTRCMPDVSVTPPQSPFAIPQYRRCVLRPSRRPAVARSGRRALRPSRPTSAARRAPSRSLPPSSHGNRSTFFLFFVTCSNAYAISINFGSLHAVPVKLTLNGAGRGSKLGGKAVVPVPRGTGRRA